MLTNVHRRVKISPKTIGNSAHKQVIELHNNYEFQCSTVHFSVQ